MISDSIEPLAARSRRGHARRRADAIYATIRDRICFLEYPPGTRLSEHRLADEFDVSRTPIRRVLQRLEFEQLAERRQGAPTVVTDFDFESLRDVYVIRMILAENTDQLSPAKDWWQRADALQLLRQRCHELRRDRDLRGLGAVHLELQEELAQLVENERARDIMMQLYVQIARIWLSLVPSMVWQQEVDSVEHEIAALIDAMEHRDIRAVGLIRRNYISMNIARMKSAMDTSGSVAS